MDSWDAWPKEVTHTFSIKKGLLDLRQKKSCPTLSLVRHHLSAQFSFVLHCTFHILSRGLCWHYCMMSYDVVHSSQCLSWSLRAFFLLCKYKGTRHSKTPRPVISLYQPKPSCGGSEV